MLIYLKNCQSQEVGIGFFLYLLFLGAFGAHKNISKISEYNSETCEFYTRMLVCFT